MTVYIFKAISCKVPPFVEVVLVKWLGSVSIGRGHIETTLGATGPLEDLWYEYWEHRQLE